MSAPRVGLIGARRRRQGLGPFVARDLVTAGAAVPCFLATSPATLASGALELEEHAGIEARGYLALDAMLDAEPLDALAILSPSDTHETWLDAAARAGLHVLCEKPLIWGDGSLAGRARALADAFRSRGLLLAENCQWPFTLDAFRALHPGALRAPPKRFAMRLSPLSSGRALLGDCLPHPLSVLQVLAPGAPHVEHVQHRPLNAGLDVRFDYCADGARVAVELRLVPDPGVPRAASLEIDGLVAERRIELPGYRMRLCDGERCVALPDPLTARIAAFAAELRAVLAGAAPADPAPIVHRMEMLDILASAPDGPG